MWYSRKRHHNKGCPGGSIFRCRCGDFETVISLVLVAMAGAGGAEIVQATNKPKSPEVPALPALPSLDSSEQAAKDAQTQQRRAALAAGGQTNVTGGSGIVLGSDIQSVSLVGS